jgi:hypothetical protein
MVQSGLVLGGLEAFFDRPRVPVTRTSSARVVPAGAWQVKNASSRSPLTLVPAGGPAGDAGDWRSRSAPSHRTEGAGVPFG